MRLTNHIGLTNNNTERKMIGQTKQNTETERKKDDKTNRQTNRHEDVQLQVSGFRLHGNAFSKRKERKKKFRKTEKRLSSFEMKKKLFKNMKVVSHRNKRKEIFRKCLLEF